MRSNISLVNKAGLKIINFINHERIILSDNNNWRQSVFIKILSNPSSLILLKS